MTRFTVPIKDILGRAYYNYKLSSDVTNGTIGGTANVTVTVTNVFGSPVANKSVSLYHQGTLVSTENTGSDGKYTWTISLGNSESLRLLTVENQTIYIRVKYDTGWVYGNGTNRWMNSNWIDYSSSLGIRVRRIGNVVHFEGTAKPQNSLTWTEGVIQIGTLPEQFRPNRTQRFVQQGSGLNKWVLSFDPDGTIGFARYGTTSNIAMPVDAWMNMYATWIVG